MTRQRREEEDSGSVMSRINPLRGTAETNTSPPERQLPGQQTGWVAALGQESRLMPHSMLVPAHAAAVRNKDNDYIPIACMWDTAQKTQRLVKDAQGEVSQRAEVYNKVQT